jgi:hypothetical protein
VKLAQTSGNAKKAFAKKNKLFPAVQVPIGGPIVFWFSWDLGNH